MIASALLLTTAMVHPLQAHAQSAPSYLLVGAGGSGGTGGNNSVSGGGGGIGGGGGASSHYLSIGFYGGNGGTGGNGTLTIENSGVLTVSTSGTLGGNGGGNSVVNASFIGTAATGGVGGNGTLNIQNGGTLVLGNNAVVAAPAAVENFDANGTTSFGISNTANFEVDDSNTATINTEIGDIESSAAGILNKTGTGTLVLAEANTYTGGTNIQSGILQIGTASAPRNYDETVSGPLTFGITPSTVPGAGYGQLQVNGSANLGGTLTVDVGTPASGSRYNVGAIYKLISATNSVSGSFTNLSLSGPYAQYLKVGMYYESNAADLKINDVDIEITVPEATLQTTHFLAANGYVQNASLFDVLSALAQTDVGY